MKRSGKWISCVLVGTLAAGVAAGAPARDPVGIFGLYAGNRTGKTPNYVTEDLLLLTYTMLVDDAIAAAEQQHAAPELEQIVAKLLAKTEGAGPQNPEAADARTFLLVIAALLKGESTSPDANAAAELARVLKAEGMDRSTVVWQQIDYSQFRPRGHYTRSEALSRYFRAYRYASTVLFYVAESQATGVTSEEADKLAAEARYLARAITGDREIATLYQKFNARWDWTFGPAEDLLTADFTAVDGLPGMKAAAPAAYRKKLLDFARKNARQPEIFAGSVDVSKLGPGQKAADVLTGWRFFPQRFTVDSAAMQQLVFDRVKNYLGTGDPFSKGMVNGEAVKVFPRGTEIFALLGSKQAAARLDQSDERNYQGYADASRKALALLKRPSGLNSETLDMLGRWASRLQATGIPDADRRLNSALAIWTYGRYLNVLQAKQSYTSVEKSIEIDPRTTAWIEPAVELYQDLKTLTMHVDQHLPSPLFAQFQKILTRCILISQQERLGRTPGKEDVAFLNGIDRDLVQLTGREDEPIVVDVHTDLNSGQVLEEGLGYEQTAEHEIGDVKAVGGLFRYYEFKHPLADRLTDAAWKKLLAEGGPK